MAKPRKPARREDGLSRERIVDAAIEVLDAEGEHGLTFRVLATRLATGPGAIYWHITSKHELLVAASDAVVARALSRVTTHAAPRKAIRAIAVAIFDAVDAHPWVGAQLVTGPWPTATMQIFERIGHQLQALRVPEAAQFTAASTLVSYLLGVSDQNAANGRATAPNADRAAVLAAEAARWRGLDADAYPFTRRMATRLGRHDDRAEFLAGIELILAGIEARRAEP